MHVVHLYFTNSSACIHIVIIFIAFENAVCFCFAATSSHWNLYSTLSQLITFPFHPFTFTLRRGSINGRCRKIIYLSYLWLRKVSFWQKKKIPFVHWPIDSGTRRPFASHCFFFRPKWTFSINVLRDESPAKNATDKSMSIILYTETLIYDNEIQKELQFLLSERDLRSLRKAVKRGSVAKKETPAA